MIAVGSSWVRHDIIHHYDVSKDKVAVIPLAPPLIAYPTPSPSEIDSITQKYALPRSFILYPAQTWPHKNHIGLLSALAVLRHKHGIIIPLVSTGQMNNFMPTILAASRRLRVEDQVHWLGFVSPLDLQCLYQRCRGVVIPTKFEAGSFPLFEAFLAGAPAACSRVTSLPEQAGDAALLFSPDNVMEIADAVARLWTDAELRATLAQRGRRRVQRFSWDRTARIFRAHYRRITRAELTEEDRHLLSSGSSL